jgi:translation initiation factor IF-2
VKKNLKLNIKNTQIAAALKITKQKLDSASTKAKQEKKTVKKTSKSLPIKEDIPKRKARILQKPSHEEEIKKAVPEEKPKKIEQPIVEETKKITEKKIATKEKEPSTKTFEVKKTKVAGPKDFHEFTPTMKRKVTPRFDSRDRMGLREQEDVWRRKRHKPIKKRIPEEEIIRPKVLSVYLPISVKDLAQAMKLKASQLITKLFMQGITLTLNDYLDDETLVQLLGQEFDCKIKVDTSEEDRLQITSKTIKEEISTTDKVNLITRPPIITFMGHVDHGKTSLIDAIRKSNIASSEAGAITQHIGAFRSKTDLGLITILDTPGHEAFTEMRERGANVTDVVVLVVAGDEGIKQQTIEAINQAKDAKVPIVVAINKCDKPNFDEQSIYRQLADNDLLPESWGGTVITINTSATTGQGIKELLEMLQLQSEILELRANPEKRARGIVLESEMHKGMGAVATLLILNGTLKKGDPMVLGNLSARIKTMQDEFGKFLEEAPPATPVKVTGLSGTPDAGCEFIVVSSEKEAKKLAAGREKGHKLGLLKSKKVSMESLLEKESEAQQKVLPLILKADVQGSLEALKNSINKIKSKKVRCEIVHEAIGEISEYDVKLAAASNATIIGFHTRVESNADTLIKQMKIPILLHNIIYHAVEDIKTQMTEMLDKTEEEKDLGMAEVKATFKSSQLGIIAGCIVTEGSIHRNHLVRLIRDKEIIWKGKIASLKRVQEDVKEVQKGIECGIVLDGMRQVQEGDKIQTYEIIYHKQKL